MYYDELMETADNEISSVEHKLNKIKAAEEARNVDKYYEKYSVLFNNIKKDGKFYKTVTIENFGSGQIGTRIRNAVTGMRYTNLVGSIDEDLFFKVIDSTGRKGRKEPLILFYDTPEQYENHHYTTLQQNVKERWYEKCLDARARVSKH
jgi:hypothetical protein